jgi:hypothetical protein
MLVSSKLNGSSDFGLIRSTFHEWKNSWEIVSSKSMRPARIDAGEVRIVLFRCSMPSPLAHGP